MAELIKPTLNGLQDNPDKICTTSNDFQLIIRVYNCIF